MRGAFFLISEGKRTKEREKNANKLWKNHNWFFSYGRQDAIINLNEISKNLNG